MKVWAQLLGFLNFSFDSSFDSIFYFQKFSGSIQKLGLSPLYITHSPQDCGLYKYEVLQIKIENFVGKELHN
jgi:hypothetical protein